MFAHLIVDDRGGGVGPKPYIAIKELVECFKANPMVRGRLPGADCAEVRGSLHASPR
jgi:hypothetical protein